MTRGDVIAAVIGLVAIFALAMIAHVIWPDVFFSNPISDPYAGPRSP